MATVNRIGDPLYVNAVKFLFGDIDIKNYVDSIESPLQLLYLYFQLRSQLGGDLLDSGINLNYDIVHAAYNVVLQRSPDSDDVVYEILNKISSTSSLLSLLIGSVEFKTRAHSLVANAFPNSVKVWHTHIPKTSGAALISYCRDAGYGIVNLSMILSKDVSIEDISRDMGLARLKRKILFTGHVPLYSFSSSISKNDYCLTFLRDPVDRVLSYFNYMKYVSEIDPDRSREDTKIFFARGFIPESFEKTYRNGDIYGNNAQCGFICSDVTAIGAIEEAQKFNVKLYDIKQASSIIMNITSAKSVKKLNNSYNYINRSDLSISQLMKIYEDNIEDLKLISYASHIDNTNDVISN